MAAEVVTTSELEKPIKKNREIIKVIEENVKGHVKWYDVAKNYGFISRDNGDGDVFVHRSVISQCARRHPSLRSGEEVQFTVVETNQGIEADSVTGPEGNPVLGQLSRYRRRSGGRIRGNHQYDAYVHTENPSGGENGEHQPPGTRPRGPHRRGANRAAGQGKENQSSGDAAAAGGDTQDPSEGDSPNQSDLRQRRPRRRPPANRNRNRNLLQSGNGVVSGNVVPEQNDGGNEQQQLQQPPPQFRRRNRRRRPANGQSMPKEGEENGHQVEAQVNGYHGPRKGGPYRGYGRRHSNPKRTGSSGEVVHSTGADLVVEGIVAATEQCSLNDSASVVVPGSEEVPAH